MPTWPRITRRRRRSRRRGSMCSTSTSRRTQAPTISSCRLSSGPTLPRCLTTHSMSPQPRHSKKAAPPTVSLTRSEHASVDSCPNCCPPVAALAEYRAAGARCHACCGAHAAGILSSAHALRGSGRGQGSAVGRSRKRRVAPLTPAASVKILGAEGMASHRTVRTQAQPRLWLGAFSSWRGSASCACAPSVGLRAGRSRPSARGPAVARGAAEAAPLTS